MSAAAATAAHELAPSHTPRAVRLRLTAPRRHSYLRDFIYGAIDGTVTTFAVVCGVAGAGLHPSVVLILGSANVIADGFSMAVSNFLGSRAEHQLREHARQIEETHVDQWPEGEREEVRQIFADKGFAGDDLERVVKVITSDRRRWIETMMREELDLPTEGPSPMRAALTTLVAFITVGLVPLLAYFFEVIVPASRGWNWHPFRWSMLMTAIAFFGVGAVKSRFIEQPWYKGGLETFGVGGAAAMLAYITGAALKGIAAAP